MTAGCLCAGVGILVTNALLNAHSGVGLFGWSLLFVGAGLGVVMVAVTSSVLGVVPAARSGMAASVVNTSRELGAVAGVAVLGSVVNGVLVTNLNQKLDAHTRPARLLAEHGDRGGHHRFRRTPQASTLPKTGPIARIVNEVLAAANSSFSDALNVILILAGLLLLASAGAAAGLVRGGRAGVEDF